jgi:hypothetical protein
VLDVFLPAALFLATTPPSLKPWIVPLQADNIATATLVYSITLVVFGAGYFFVSRQGPSVPASLCHGLAAIRVKVGHVYVALAVVGGWYVLHQAVLISEAGSFDVFLSEKFRQRLRPDVYVSTSIFDFVFNQFAPMMLPAFLVLVGVLFFFRYRYVRPVLWGLVLPATAWLLTLTTFYRGTQLNLFITLAFIEAYRIRVAKLHPQARLSRTPVPTSSSTISRRSKVLAATGVLVFLLYGGYRQYHSSFQYNNPVSVTEAFAAQTGEFLRGWGVVGLTSILYFYPDNGEHLGGTSIAETFLMPVPRLLWAEKPERYGAEEVTRRMGWPTTTQSAITMPGELYANFGAVGVIGVGAFGLFFRGVYRRRLHPKAFFAYAFFVPYAVLLSHWMSSTGLMTAVTLYPVALAVVWLVLERDAEEPPRDGGPVRQLQPASRLARDVSA